jgi:flagellar FliL protein
VLVKGEASVEILKKHMPMVRNNLLMAITSIGAEKAKTVEGKKELQALMLSEMGKVMEKMNNNKNPVKDVYFTDFVMQ